MKSWKTTAGSLIAALGVWASAQSDPWWLWKVGQVLNIVGLIVFGVSARDNAVPSSAIPAAAARAEQIKQDTKPPVPTTP
jgi:hypothetical protein